VILYSPGSGHGHSLDFSVLADGPPIAGALGFATHWGEGLHYRQ
jgi:hypothetical protein